MAIRNAAKAIILNKDRIVVTDVLQKIMWSILIDLADKINLRQWKMQL